MTLRTRLILALLVVALVPAGAMTVFSLVHLDRAMERWHRPGVESALQSALEVTKGSMARLEATVMTQALTWAGAWPSGPLTPAVRAEAAASLKRAGLDFIQVYRPSPRGWSLIEEVVPEGIMVIERRDLGSEIPPRLQTSQVLHSSGGALAAISPLRDGGALAAGLWVHPDFFARIDSVAQGTTYYRQLGVTVELQRVSVWLLVGLVAVGTLALAVLLAHAFARQTSRPLRELSTALEGIAGGNLATRVTPRGAPELRSLGVSFNAMSERLEAARDALQRAEREAAWRDVARKLAHEFKNMLTPMQLSLQLLEKQVDSVPAERREAMKVNLQATLDEVDHLGRLAEQFSQYARLPEPRFESLDLAEVVRSAATLHPQARLRVVPPSEEARVRGDLLLLSRAIHNLLLNALEASPPEAVVELRTESRGDEVVVEILDQGPGLPPELRDRLFDPYVSTKRRGSGLGLSLVRDITRQHGGTVTLENRPSGGALARLALPRARENGRAAT